MYLRNNFSCNFRKDSSVPQEQEHNTIVQRNNTSGRGNIFLHTNRK